MQSYTFRDSSLCTNTMRRCSEGSLLLLQCLPHMAGARRGSHTKSLARAIFVAFHGAYTSHRSDSRPPSGRAILSMTGL